MNGTSRTGLGDEAAGGQNADVTFCFRGHLLYVNRDSCRAALLLLFPLFALSAQTAPGECLQRTAEDFVPETRSERIAYAINGITGPTAFVYAAIRAGINQADNEPREWAQGAAGFGRRFGSAYGEHFVGEALEQGIALALHEDNRYFASGEQGFGRRLRYALASTFLARHDDGSRGIAVSSIGSAAGTAFLSRAWQPRSTRSAGDAAVTFGLTLAARAGFNVAREFSPRFFARMFR